MSKNGDSEFFEIYDNEISPRYEVIKKIYESKRGYSSIYVARRFGRLFILKTLQEKYRGSDLYKGLLNKEFEISFNLDHPNLCKVYEIVSIPGLGISIVMEYVDGKTLSEYINDKRVTTDLLEKFIYEVSGAMEYFHKKQIIHRDLKPDNILITNKGNNFKVIDFGLSDCDDFDIFTGPAGTRHYASPELIESKDPDQRSDIYSFGVILEEICSEIHMPGYFSKLAKKCSAHNVENRISESGQIKLYYDKLKRVAEFKKRMLWFSIPILAGILVIVIQFAGSKTKQGSTPAKSIIDTSAQVVALPAISKGYINTNSQASENNAVNIKRNPDESYYESYRIIETQIDSFRRREIEKMGNGEFSLSGFSADSSKISNQLRGVVKKEFSGNEDSWQMHSCIEWIDKCLKKISAGIRDGSLTGR